MFKYMNKKSEKGVLSLEMVVAVGIFGSLLLMSTPHVEDLAGSFERRHAIIQLQSDLQQTRAKATAEGTRAILALQSGGTSYTLGIDEPPYSDPATADDVILSRSFDGEVSATASRTIIFDSKGFLIDVNGDPVTATFVLNYRGVTYRSGTIQATGSIEYD